MQSHNMCVEVSSIRIDLGKMQNILPKLTVLIESIILQDRCDLWTCRMCAWYLSSTKQALASFKRLQTYYISGHLETRGPMEAET